MERAERVSGTPAPTALREHRAAFAARLCDGLRVADLGDGGDALARLRRLDPAGVDAVVALDLLDGLPAREEALDRLEELAGAGVRLVLAVTTEGARGPGYEEAMEAFGRLGPVTVLHQHAAEGSVIAGPAPERLEGEAAALADAEPESASALIALAGFPEETVRAAAARLAVAAEPVATRRLRELEAANDELWRANVRLSRGWLSRSDAAAAAAVDRYERRIAELEAEVTARDEVIRAREARIEELTIVARRNDELYQLEKAWHDAPRYRAVDRLRDALVSVPGLAPAARLGWRLVSRFVR